MGAHIGEGAIFIGAHKDEVDPITRSIVASQPMRLVLVN